MGEFLSTLIGFAVAGFVIWGAVNFLDAASKPKRKRRRTPNRNHEKSRRQFDFNEKISEFQYYDNEAPGEFLVYFIENPRLNALKIGVGRAGRVHQLLNSHIERDEHSLSIGWRVLRVAVFSNSSDDYRLGREKANEAERRVKFYWKSQGIPPYLTDEQMGYSKINVRKTGETIWIRTQGWSETVELGAVCEVSSWNFVRNSPGFLGEYSSFTIGRELALLNPEHAERVRPPNLTFPSKRGVKQGTEVNQPGKTIDTDANQNENKYGPRPESDGTQIGNFHARTKPSDTSECLIWTGSVLTDSGYGIMPWNGVLTPAHRIAWIIEFNDDLTNSHLFNKCDNRLCVNTAHWEKITKQTFTCITKHCNEVSETTFKPGLCKKCAQRAKVIRRAVREGRATKCPTPGCENMSTGTAVNSRCVDCAAIARSEKP